MVESLHSIREVLCSIPSAVKINNYNFIKIMPQSFDGSEYEFQFPPIL